MRIEVKGRNVPITEELRDCVTRRFRKVDAQVSELAELEIELSRATNPAVAEPYRADATLRLKGVTLRAHDASRDAKHAIHLVEEELSRQVKRHRVQRRHRRDARRLAQTQRAQAEGGAPA
ncbi:MAG: ribosome-associated translation inhibitor RaiA [Solirubrobacteraceae bacterium]|nr:ribosome-associated translation inhibitor RaiA [Solirubrobacteraceae bacterium]